MVAAVGGVIRGLEFPRLNYPACSLESTDGISEHKGNTTDGGNTPLCLPLPSGPGIGHRVQIRCFGSREAFRRYRGAIRATKNPALKIGV